MSGVSYRRIQPRDNQPLERVIRSGMEEFGLDRPGSGYDDPEMSDLHGAYNRQGSGFFVAVRDGRVLGGGGIALLSGGDGKTCELQRMYLDPAARGLGVGHMLLTHCLELAVELGYHFCYLETMSGMEAARKLYATFGFRKQEGRVGQTGHCACNTWYLKPLSP